MRVLVTGGFGFIGGRLCKYLDEQESFDIVCSSRIPHAETNSPRLSTAIVDWACIESLKASCADVDVVVHLAAMNAGDSANDPVSALMVNGVATIRLLEAAKAMGVRRFIYLSTAHVYGSPLVGILTEDTCPAPVHPYATSHRAAEDAVIASDYQGAIEGIVIRLSNSFGAPARPDINCWGLLINDLCRQAVTTNLLELRSTGLQRRDFIPMTDVCRAIKHFMVLPKKMLQQQIFNVGSGWSPTLLDVVNMIADRCEQSFGVRPSLTLQSPLSGETAANLDYRIDALCATGFVPSTDPIMELDNLLSFCNYNFGVEIR
jgi:UDP-glucose 4-epimerase